MERIWLVPVIVSILILGTIGFSQEADAVTINISNSAGLSSDSSIVADGTNIYITWRDVIAGNAEILFSKSTDGGATFSVPQNISNSAGFSVEPFITTDGTNLYVTWFDNTAGNPEILFSKSTDGGVTFSVPQNISNNAGDSRVPAIITDGTNLYVTWWDDTAGNFEILFSKSTDGGTTFSVPQNISNNAGQSRLSAIATDGTNIYVTWDDNSAGIIQILFSKSTDGGATFSVPQNISNTAGSSAIPSITTDGTNNLLRNEIN